MLIFVSLKVLICVWCAHHHRIILSLFVVCSRCHTHDSDHLSSLSSLHTQHRTVQHCTVQRFSLSFSKIATLDSSLFHCRVDRRACHRVPNSVHDKKAHEENIGNNGKVIFLGCRCCRCCCCYFVTHCIQTATKNKFSGLLYQSLSLSSVLTEDDSIVWVYVCIGVWAKLFISRFMCFAQFSQWAFFLERLHTTHYSMYYCCVRWTYFQMISDIVQSFLPYVILVNSRQNRF